MFRKVWIMVLAVIVFLPVITIAEQKKIIISGTDWEPYTGANLPENGFFTEIAVKSLEKAGYNVEVKIVPWKRALETTKLGSSDGLLGASFTEERTQFLQYPKYYWESASHFFVKTREEKITFATVEALCPATIGIILGSFYQERFKKIKCITLDTSPTVNLNIKKLLGGRFDYLIESKDSVNYIMKKEFPSQIGDIEPIFPHYEIDRIFMAFSKKNPNYQQISDDFDKGVKMIQEAGTYEEILKKHGIH